MERPKPWWIIFNWLENKPFTAYFVPEIALHSRRLLSQMYGSTTVVMATPGSHWKWQSLSPCQRHPSEPIEIIFGTIDCVIDLNNLAKFGFGKTFLDGGTHTQHIRVRPFFSFFFFFYNFLRSLMRVQPKRLNRFWRAISQSTPFSESQTLF